MTVARLVSATASGYMVGAVPVADVGTRLATGGTGSLRSEGTGNPGGANALVVLGKRWGYGIILADIAKGAAACGVGRSVAGDAGAHLAGTAAVIGHCFPVWSRFRGGKGVAVSLGQCAATFPPYVPVDLAVAWAAAAKRWPASRFSSPTLAATVIASSAWVAASLLSWRRRWPNAWGPSPTALMPAAAAASSAVILSRFAAAARAATAAVGVPANPT
ncbi:MAG TPA: glycerol-3-phosphate acyltransferase [Acidimicrobiales bacterium]|nr:glycerol-3-phosphate acyltransferase [Acidimicrobiales bacterium]